MSDKKKTKKHIKKEDVLRGIEICSTMRSHWKNGNYPSSSYEGSVKRIQDLLGKLLQGGTVKIK